MINNQLFINGKNVYLIDKFFFLPMRNSARKTRVEADIFPKEAKNSFASLTVIVFSTLNQHLQKLQNEDFVHT